MLAVSGSFHLMTYIIKKFNKKLDKILRPGWKENGKDLRNTEEMIFFG